MSGKFRLIIAAAIAFFAIASYYGKSSLNPITGEKQRVSLSPEQEIAMGMQTAPQMAAQFGGLSSDAQARALVKKVGNRLVAQSVAVRSPYKYDFHLLADSRTINAFALPGGQIFITEGLLKLLRTEGELAAVLGHEIGHVIARHSAEHLAKQALTQGLVGAAVVGSGDMTTAQIAQQVGAVINMKYGRDDEIESDGLGIRLAAEAGYDPRAMIRVMQALAKASSGARQPEMLSTHPNPENRVGKIKAEIEKQFPSGVPEGLVASAPNRARRIASFA
ncbi:MAG: M48 family metallopeptidase [Burkholderiales bacterium]|nr:M48 family metallopeptidase [Burkholderiales bacterium]